MIKHNSYPWGEVYAKQTKQKNERAWHVNY